MARAERRGKAELLRLVDAVLTDVDYQENPFFTALNGGSFSRDDFLETQYQFYWAVIFFSRPMSALAAKIPDSALRVAILRNVWEEHGSGETDDMHGTTFVKFLSRLSGKNERAVMREIGRRTLWPEIRAFNTLLVGACVLDDYLIGAGVMGIIERMFAEISGWIGRAVVDRGFMTARQLIHYSLHEKLDVRHAADFFDVLAPAWSKGQKARGAIEQGLRMGAIVFDQLYARLYRCRTRRWLRE